MLTSVACVATTFCVAVDDAGNAIVYDGTSWSMSSVIDASHGLSAVSCATIDFCVAVDGRGDAVTYDGSSWSLPRTILHDRTPLTAVSCAAANFCVAAAASLSYPGYAVAFTGTDWTTMLADSGANITSVSCPAVNDCVAVDELGTMRSYTVGGSEPSTMAYWELSGGGAIYPAGSARVSGEPAAPQQGYPAWVALASTPGGGGYWVMNADASVSAYGDAVSYPLSVSVGGTAVSIASTPDGAGYWVATSTGSVFSAGDAADLGSPAESGVALAGRIVRVVASPDGHGYWLVAADGGVFAYGDAPFEGSMAGSPLESPISSLVSTPDGLGYWMLGADGGVFAFGDAPFAGSAYLLDLVAGTAEASPVSLMANPAVSLLPSADGRGYLIVTAGGVALGFGDASPSGVTDSDLPPDASSNPVTDAVITGRSS